MRNRLKIVVGALLGVALIYLFAKDLDGRAVLETIREANWTLLAIAAALIVSTFVIRAVRWRALLMPIGPGARFSSLFGATAAGVVGLYYLHHHRASVTAFLDRRLQRLGRKVRRGVVSIVGNFAEALSILHDGRELVIVSAWSLLLWFVCVLANDLVFRAFGLDLPTGAAVFVLGFGLIGSLVPTPGGAAGAFHVATAGGLLLLGTGENDAKSIAIVLHLLAFGVAVPLGLLVLLGGGYSLSRLRAALREDLTSTHDFARVGFEPPIGPIAQPEEIQADR